MHVAQASWSRGRCRKTSRPAQVAGLGVTCVAIALTIVALLLLRGEALLSHSFYDPTEATLLASGRQATRDLVPYRGYTAVGYFYLWPFLLGVSGKLGIPLTFPIAHVISACAYAFMCLVGWLYFSREHGWRWASAIIVPPAVVLLGTQSFLALIVEIVPILLLCAATLVLLPAQAGISQRRLAIASFLSGWTIWADPQMAPLAISFVVCGVLLRSLEERHNAKLDETSAAESASTLVDASVAALSFLAPSMISVALIGSEGGLHALTDESLPFVFQVAGFANKASATLGSRTQTLGGYLISAPFAAVWVLGGLLGWQGITSGQNRQRLRLTIWVLPVIGSALSVLIVGPYSGPVIYIGAILSGIFGCRIARISKSDSATVRQPSSILRTIVAFAAALALLDVANTVWENLVFMRGYVASVVEHGSFPSVNYYYFGPSQLSTICRSGSSVLVWGDSPELYTYYNWQPATRYVNTLLQIFPYTNSIYYRSTLLLELEAKPPKCIVEAIGPLFDGNIGRRSTLARDVPGSGPYLRACYEKRMSSVGSVAGDPEYFQSLVVYARKSSCVYGLVRAR